MRPSPVEAMRWTSYKSTSSTSGAFYRTLTNGVKKKTIFHWIVIDSGTGRDRVWSSGLDQLIAYHVIMRSVGYLEARKCLAKSCSFGRPKSIVMRPVGQKGGAEMDKLLAAP